MTKNKTTILERAIDGARRIIKPMTKEEEYRTLMFLYLKHTRTLMNGW